MGVDMQSNIDANKKASEINKDIYKLDGGYLDMVVTKTTSLIKCLRHMMLMGMFCK
jgi:hypothetical protein